MQNLKVILHFDYTWRSIASLRNGLIEWHGESSRNYRNNQCCLMNILFDDHFVTALKSAAVKITYFVIS